MTLRNTPSGWAAFRELRQQPAPIPKRQHGNYRHGRFSRSGRTSMAMIRLCVRMLRGGLGHMPVSGFGPGMPLGWRAYRERCGVQGGR
jgi:hypothetical protein